MVKEKGKVWFHVRPSFRYNKTDSNDSGKSETFREGSFVNSSENTSSSESDSRNIYLDSDVTFREIGGKTNRTLRFAFVPSISASKSTSVTETVLYNEWFKETIGEGLRLSTIKRFGNGYSVRTPQPAAEGLIMDGASYQFKSLDASDYHLNWPIPTNDIQTNPNIVQNPGY